MIDIISIPGFTEPVSSWSHLAAAGASFIGAFFLYARGHGNASRVFSLMLFSFSLVFLFSMSGVYHLLEIGGDPRAVFRRLDHAGIWILIAGTFTPMHVILFRGPMRWGILSLVWTIAITGLTLEVVFFENFPEWLSTSLFLGLGWIGALSGYHFKKQFDDQSLRLLMAGGAFYSIGAICDFFRWPIFWPGVIGSHELFHFFVIAGALSHWLFIYKWANHPLKNTIVFHIRMFPDGKYLAEAKGEHIRLEAKSLEELKLQIKQQVSQKYHTSIAPVIRLIYFQEEYLV